MMSSVDNPMDKMADKLLDAFLAEQSNTNREKLVAIICAGLEHLYVFPQVQISVPEATAVTGVVELTKAMDGIKTALEKTLPLLETEVKKSRKRPTLD